MEPNRFYSAAYNGAFGITDIHSSFGLAGSTVVAAKAFTSIVLRSPRSSYLGGLITGFHGI